MSRDVLQEWADATGMYIAFPKRWPDEDCAIWLHLFFHEPHLDEEGEWTDGVDVQSIDIEDCIPLNVRQIDYKESLRKPKVSSWDNFIKTDKFLRWDINALMNIERSV